MVIHWSNFTPNQKYSSVKPIKSASINEVSPGRQSSNESATL